MERESQFKDRSQESNKDHVLELDDSFSEMKSLYSSSKKNGKWTEEEDELLKSLVNHYGNKNWKKISQEMHNKTAVQCLHRWTKILKPGLTKGPWSIEEDRKLIEWVRTEGPSKWSQCADHIVGRSGKQCRERWYNTLHPEVKKGNWTAEEDFLIFASFSKFGSKWSNIAKELPGRTENSIKNRFYSTLRRISTEQKKSKPQGLKCNSEYNSSMTNNSSLVDLLAYFPQALEEKKKLYSCYKNSNCQDLAENLIENNEAKLLNKKKSRSFKVPLANNSNGTTNINHTYNFNLNISTPLIEGLQTNKNKTVGIDDLENAIDKWYGDDFHANDNSFENLETKINKLININENINNSQKNMSNSKPINNKVNYQSIIEKEVDTRTPSGCDSINNLLNQLNELEKILQMTKQELYNAENKNKNVSANMSSQNNLFINDCLQNLSNINGGCNIGAYNDFNNLNNLLSPNVNLNGISNLTNLSNMNQSKSLAFEDFSPEEANTYFIEHMFKF